MVVRSRMRRAEVGSTVDGQSKSIQEHSWVMRKKSGKRTKPSDFLGGRVDCSPQGGYAENEGRINDFNSKISIIAREIVWLATLNLLIRGISTSHISLSVVNRVECTFNKWCGEGGGVGEERVGALKNYSRFCKKKHLLLAKLALKDVIQYSAKYFNRYH